MSRRLPGEVVDIYEHWVLSHVKIITIYQLLHQFTVQRYNSTSSSSFTVIDIFLITRLTTDVCNKQRQSHWCVQLPSGSHQKVKIHCLTYSKIGFLREKCHTQNYVRVLIKNARWLRNKLVNCRTATNRRVSSSAYILCSSQNWPLLRKKIEKFWKTSLAHLKITEYKALQ